ncbi:hypothetical protein, partial [Pseudomonas sp. 69_B]|uniref:hypothetical protein n=1 Tax=Pseudomonas sp. 69_B TaxID=2813563 RepID=UPI001A9E225D
RGFIPAGLRSSPKTIQRGDSVRSGQQDLRLLRSRTGINPLTTVIFQATIGSVAPDHPAKGAAMKNLE